MDKERLEGLTDKYTVIRNDGSSFPMGKHNGCSYFVLDLTHDKFAEDALRAYAEACAKEYPLLAKDLLNGVDQIMFLSKEDTD